MRAFCFLTERRRFSLRRKKFHGMGITFVPVAPGENKVGIPAIPPRMSAAEGGPVQNGKVWPKT